jgi:hypothetical protein
VTPGVVDITIVTEWTVEARGKATIRLLKKAGVPRLYAYKPLSGGKPCWIFPVGQLGDVLAAADVMRGVRVVLHQHQQALL